MLILKIRDVYKAPYHKNKYIILKKKDCESVIYLKKKLHEYTGNWSSGLYDIQFVTKEGTYMQPTIYATLVRIEVRDGKVAKEIYKSQFDEMGVEMTKSEGLTSLIKCEKFRTN